MKFSTTVYNEPIMLDIQKKAQEQNPIPKLVTFPQI